MTNILGKIVQVFKVIVTCLLGDFLEKKIPPRKMLLGPWLPEQGLAMVYAPRGVGKTFFGLNVAAAVAFGSEFMRWEAGKPKTVLYIDGEMPAVDIQGRLADITQGVPKGRLKNFRLITPDEQPHSMINLCKLEDQELLEEQLEDVDLIVVDNIATLCRGGVENEAQSWTPVQEWALRQRAKRKSVLFIHHSGKNGSQRGTSAREDVLDTVIKLQHPKGYSAENGCEFEIIFEKNRGFDGDDAKSLHAKLIKGDNKNEWSYGFLENSMKDKIIALHQAGTTRPVDIAEELGLTKGYISRILTEAKRTGKIKKK